MESSTYQQSRSSSKSNNESITTDGSLKRWKKHPRYKENRPLKRNKATDVPNTSDRESTATQSEPGISSGLTRQMDKATFGSVGPNKFANEAGSATGLTPRMDGVTLGSVKKIEHPINVGMIAFSKNENRDTPTEQMARGDPKDDYTLESGYLTKASAKSGSTNASNFMKTETYIGVPQNLQTPDGENAEFHRGETDNLSQTTVGSSTDKESCGTSWSTMISGKPGNSGEAKVPTCEPGVSSYLSAQEKFDQQRKLVEEELKRLLNENELWNAQVALAYGKVAVAFLEEGRDDEAMEFLQKQLEIEKKVFAGDDHLQMGSTYHNIARVFYGQGKYEEAMTQLKKALEIKLKAHGPENVECAKTYHSMGVVLERQGKYEEAMTQLDVAINIKLKVYGSEHPETAKTYHSRGVVWDSQGKHEKAMKHYQLALSIYSKVFQPDHQETAKVYLCMGNVLASQRKYEEAMEKYQEALRIYSKEYGNRHRETAKTYNNMGMVLERQGEYEKAMERYLEACNINLQTHRTEHPENARTYHNMGVIFKRQGNNEDSLKYFEMAFKIEEKAFGPEHVSTRHSAGCVWRMALYLDMTRKASKFVCFVESLVAAVAARARVSPNRETRRIQARREAVMKIRKKKLLKILVVSLLLQSIILLWQKKKIEIPNMSFPEQPEQQQHADDDTL